MNRAFLLTWILRAVGTTLCLAFFAMVMPTSWMTESNARLGLEAFPEQPLTDYLTRSLSAMYGFHGLLMWVVSFDPVRLRPVALFLGAKNVLFGSAMLAIDLNAGLPPWWTLLEGPPIVAVGCIVLFLARGLPRRDA